MKSSPATKRRAGIPLLAVLFLLTAASHAPAQFWGGGELAPIKGLTLGMPIDEAVAVMNEKAGPIWAATMGQASANPYKVMRIPGENMQALRLQIIQLMSLATMQLYRVDPADTEDLFIVVPSTAPDTAQDLGQVGSGVLQSLLFTGFFAWAGEDGKVNLFIIGPTLCNALFDASLMPMEQFAKKFADAYSIPRWSEPQDPDATQVLLYESSSGQSIALAADDLGRRTLVVWNAKSATPVQPGGKGAFD